MTQETEEMELVRDWSITEFFALAKAIEAEAVERYDLLADQMEVHNNREIAAIFRKMAAIEGQHQRKIVDRAASAGVDDKTSFSWIRPSGPEAIDFEDAHYLMTPNQALQLARFNEQRAVAFFEAVARKASDGQVRAFALELAKEERQHVVWLDQWLQQFPETENGWDEDPDPPIYSE
ncbi:ferritin family protein [Rhodoblastus sp.]|jgi:rubrerythrin|uniref:ferritin-like domain-containing protein n=1 Tax=Rhodoblastus sp. TaxID=1962975 RepID=UPI00262BBD19|nr:ferritin family protein [Rhodoblastus sp.]